MNSPVSGATFGDEPSKALHSTAVALVIGIGRYENPSIPTLAYPVEDAKGFCDALRHSGFDSVRLLLEKDATLDGIKKAITGLRDQVAGNPEATAVIFFCGHGDCEIDPENQEPDGYSKYLLPFDTDPRNLVTTALRSGEFTRLVATVKAKKLVIFLDACYSGAVIEAGGAKARGSVSDASDISNDLQKQLKAKAATVIISAARSNQRSFEHESLKHGIFTHHLIEALSGKADFDSDGYVRVRDVYRYLEENVPATAERLCKQVQTPIMNPMPLEAAPNHILAVDTSKLKAIERDRRIEALEQLFRKKALTFAELEEARKIVEAPNLAEGSDEALLAECLFPLLDNPDTATIEPYLAVRRSLRRPIPQPPKASVQPLPVPDSTPPVEVVLDPQPATRSWAESAQKVGKVVLPAGFVALIAGVALYSALFSPKIDVVAKDVDWEPRSPKVGEEVTFTGKFATTYRIRQGVRWKLDDIPGKEQLGIFTATWSVIESPEDKKFALTIRTGEIAETQFKATFQKPGEYTIAFSIKSELGNDDQTNDKVVRPIVVQAQR